MVVYSIWLKWCQCHDSLYNINYVVENWKVCQCPLCIAFLYTNIISLPYIFFLSIIVYIFNFIFREQQCVLIFFFKSESGWYYVLTSCMNTVHLKKNDIPDMAGCTESFNGIKIVRYIETGNAIYCSWASVRIPVYLSGLRWTWFYDMFLDHQLLVASTFHLNVHLYLNIHQHLNTIHMNVINNHFIFCNRKQQAATEEVVRAVLVSRLCLNRQRIWVLLVLFRLMVSDY